MTLADLVTAHVSANYQRKNPRHGDWETPPDFFKRLNEEFAFTLDAAASHENALCSEYFTPEGRFFHGSLRGTEDGLRGSWANRRVFCNPPYDTSIRLWCLKAAQREADIAVLLLPPSIDTAWFHDYVWGVAEVRFLRGRLKFYRNGVVGPAPRAGNMLAVYRK